jgi:hypothetical protein
MEELLKKIDIALDNKKENDRELFVDVLIMYLSLTKKTHQNFADELRLSRTSIQRWIEGRNLPVRAMRVPMFRWIKKDIETRLYSENE